MPRTKKLTRRVTVAFIAVASMLLGMGATITAMEWGLIDRLSPPVVVMLLLTLLPVPCLSAFAADRYVCRSEAQSRRAG